MADNTGGFERIGPVTAPPDTGGFEKTSPGGGNQGSVLGAMFRGFLHGAGDILYGGAQLGARMGPEIGGAAFTTPQQQQSLVGRVDQAAQQREQAYQTDPRLQGGMRGPAAGFGRVLGNAATTLPLAMGPGASASIPARIGAGAAAGAAGAMMQPVTGDYWSTKAQQMALGAGVGGAIGGAAAGIVGAAGAGLPRELQATAKSFPIVGKLLTGVEGRTLENFNTAAVNQALEPLGVTVPGNLAARHGAPMTMRGGGFTGRLIDFAGDRFRDAYGNLLPKLSLAKDPQLTQDLEALRQGATDMGDDDMRQFSRILTNRFGENERLLVNGLDGKAIKQIEGDLRDKAINAGKQGKAELADHLYEARDTFLEAVERQNPTAAAELKRINAGYSMYARVESAAAAAARRGPGPFTPQDLRNASFRSDRSARKGNFARGADTMQGIANAADHALSKSNWSPGAVSRIVTPLVAAVAGGHEAGGLGAAVGGGAAAALPPAVSAMRSMPGVAPAARGIARGVSGLAPSAGGTAAQRMEAARKVGEIRTKLYSANRRGDLAEMQKLNGELADAEGEYSKVAPSSNALARAQSQRYR